MDGMERGRRGSHTERERERVGIPALQFWPKFSLFQSNHTQLLLTKYRENGRLTFGMYAVSFFFSFPFSPFTRPPPPHTFSFPPPPLPKKTKTKNQYLDPNGWDLGEKKLPTFLRNTHTHTHTHDTQRLLHKNTIFN